MQVRGEACLGERWGWLLGGWWVRVEVVVVVRRMMRDRSQVGGLG